MRKFIACERLLLGLCLLLLLGCDPASGETIEAPVLVLDARAGSVYLLGDKPYRLLQQSSLPYALHEKILTAPDQRFAYLSSPEGWIVKLDIQAWRMSSPVGVGKQTSGMALSHDGRYLMVANESPARLVALDARDMSVMRIFDVQDRQGKPSAIAALHTAAARNSFVAVMRDIPELWEISYDEHAEPVYEGLVHDYRMNEGLALPGQFTPRRTILQTGLSHIGFDHSFTHAIGVAASGKLEIINLNVRRKIRDLDLGGSVQPDKSVVLEWPAGRMLVLPHADEAWLSVVDMQSWHVVRRIASGAGDQLLVTHPQARHVWMISAADNSAVQILDKQTLAIVPDVPAVISGSSAPLAWSREGKLAFLRDAKDANEILVCDTQTLAIVQRLRLP
ncbi:MAG: cytochrome D1 domain-containing protein [Sterolibacterium sp.]